MENLTSSHLLEATFVFDLANLCIVSTLKSGEKHLNVTLKPGETRILRFILVDPTLAWGYSYTFSYKVSETVASEEELVSIVKAKGELKVVTYQGQDTPARYWVHFLNETYVFVFENLQHFLNEVNEEVFKATFKFVLDNLRIEDEPEGGTTFKIELRPGQRMVRKLRRINNAAESKYKCSFSYCLVNSISLQSKAQEH